MTQVAPTAAPGRVHGLAAALTSFVGRAGAVTEVAGLLGEYRLVTVTGPGGVGKTRLAAEVARRVAAGFADGVWLAELARVQDPALLPAAVAVALGLHQPPGTSILDSLTAVLARQQLLLVLDNCEHLLAAAAELCGALLPAADDVRILATSREPVGIAGEARYRLAPLSLPVPGLAGDADGSEAVALFADRARLVDPHFVVAGEAGSLVGRLVARLDGMPLAIELAAARVEALGVAQLVDRIDDRFGLLVAGDRRASARQRSLAATVEWSYQLLDADEQRVFRLVSVFPGPFTLAAAEAVAGDGAGPTVLRLVDCSLVSPPRAGSDGRARYLMLETLRAYGARLLDQAGERAEAEATLARWALSVAGQAAAGLATGTAEVAAARRLDAEDAAMSQVLAWAMDHDPAMALRMAVALAPWWFLRGRLVGQYSLLREAAGRGAPGGDLWCDAQFWLGRAAVFSGDLAGALGHSTAVRDAIGDRGPSRALTDCLCGRSVVLSNLGRTPEAAEDGQRALAMAHEVGYPAGQALALKALIIAAYVAGDLGGTVQLAWQAAQIPADIPGWIARECSHWLIEMLTEAGDLAAAESVCVAGLARCRDAGDLRNLAMLLMHMAVLNLRAGRAGDAAAHLQEALRITARADDRLDLLDVLDCCAHLCVATQRRSEALTVWAAHAALIRHEGLMDDPLVRRRHEPLCKARQALGPARTRAAEERGTAMSLATATEYALMLTSPAQQPAGAPDPGKLSARERQLIILVAQGRTDAQIAGQLYISVRTVRSHLDRIRDKTGCRRRADLTRLALQAGLV